MEGRPSLESGASQNDMDYLHVVDWKKAEQVAAAGKTETIAGMKVVRLQTSIDEGILHFVPEPKSPHGVDVAPDGKDIVVGGKLDTHATVYSIGKIKALIAAKKFAGKDPYGVPILPFEEAMRIFNLLQNSICSSLVIGFDLSECNSFCKIARPIQIPHGPFKN